jgi:hypothetical protein
MDWQTALTAFGGTLLGVAFLLLCAVFLWSIVQITRIALAHRQRMALIARGMHPDLAAAPEPSGGRAQSPPAPAA